MPWYRIPFNMAERGRRAALEVEPSKLTEALLELVKCATAGDGILAAGGMVHMNFGRRENGKAPRPCCVCGWISERECDWIIRPGPIEDATCDAALCAYCTFEPAPGKDICPKHVGPLKAWLAGRTNTVDGAG